jgi:hypothetical protein
MDFCVPHSLPPLARAYLPIAAAVPQRKSTDFLGMFSRYTTDVTLKIRHIHV